MRLFWIMRWLTSVLISGGTETKTNGIGLGKFNREVHVMSERSGHTEYGNVVIRTVVDVSNSKEEPLNRRVRRRQRFKSLQRHGIANNLLHHRRLLNTPTRTHN